MKTLSPLRRLRHSVLRCVWCFLFVAAIMPGAQGQENIFRSGTQSPTEKIFGEQRRKKRPQPASETDGVAFSQIIRDTEPPYTDSFRDLTVGGREVAKLGPQGAAVFHANFHNSVRFRTPFTEGVRPEDAELKFRNLYLDVTAISAEMLYSDNIHRDNANKEAGFIALTRLNFGLLYQLGDNLKISVRSALIYLPQRNKIGIAGLNLSDPFLEAFLGPLGALQLSYDLNWGEWKIQLLEELVIRQRAFGAGLTYDLLEGETFDEQDVAGRYRTESSGILAGTQNRSRESDFGDSLVVIENTVGAKATRMLPTETRMTVGAYHRNMWYKGNRTVNLPGSQDSGFINLVSERETMRFKPFAGYRVYKHDTQDDWNQTFRTGIRGPITDYISFLTDVGFYRGLGDSSQLLWRARLEHNPNPYLLHRIEYNREVTEPLQQLESGLIYRIRYQLSKSWFVEGFTSVREVEDLETDSPRSDQLRSGLRLTHHASERSTITLTGFHTKVGFDQPARLEYETWTGRLRALYRLSTSLNVVLTYQYETRRTTGITDEYDENVILGEVTKYF